MSQSANYHPVDPSPEVLRFLDARRSPSAKLMQDGGPDAVQIDEIIHRAARVPDHRKLGPWRFIVIEGKARETFGATIADRFNALNPKAKPGMEEIERARFLRAPTIIAIVSSPIDCPRGTPEWEQIMSAGAVCFQMLLVARAMGFGAQWLSEWIAFDPEILSALGLSEREKIAGFIYLGKSEQSLPPRPRPDVAARISRL